jgi:hypothetical protein
MFRIAEMLTSLRLSLTSPFFYQKTIPGLPLKNAVRYFVTILLTLAVTKSLILTATIVPAAEESVRHLRGNVADIFPADLTIHIVNGQVSTNVKEPYLLSSKILDPLRGQAASDLTPDGNATTNFLVIDTKATINDYKKYQTWLLIIKSGFIIADAGGDSRYYPLPANSNLTIDRHLLSRLWSEYSPYRSYTVPAIIVVIWSLNLVLPLLWYPIYLVFGAGLLTLAARFTRHAINFTTAYKTGLFGLTLPLIMEFVFFLLGIPLLPFLFTTAFLIFTLRLVNTPLIPAKK